MAIYHCSVKIIGRSSGRSSVASAAYRAGEKLHNERDGMTHDYSHREDVIYTEIMLPKNAPKEFSDRQTLWNAVEKVEKRSDSQTAREFELAIPIEFNRPEGIKVIRDYVSKNFVDKGMCADIAIHDSEGNPHAHIMLTMRPVTEKGFGSKMGASRNEWNSKKQLIEWRKEWANTCNEHLKAKGFHARIDHRTLEAQGIDREPTIHLGTTANQMKKQGNISERWEINVIIEQSNSGKAQDNAEARKIDRLTKKLERDKEYISYLQGKIDDLQTKRATAKNKNEIDEHIQQLEKSLGQAIAQTERELEEIDRISIRDNTPREPKTPIKTTEQTKIPIREKYQELTRDR